MRRSFWLLLWSACLLVVSLQTVLLAQPATEPPAPKPTDAIAKLLETADGLEKEGKQVEALQTVEGALKSAQSANDLVGVAQSQRSRARLLASLDRREEALAVWREAAQVWERVGDGPGRVEALGQAGALSGADPEERKRLLAQALAWGKGEGKRPLGAAASLNTIGKALGLQGRLREAQTFFEVALSIQEKLAPNSLDMARSLHNLGTLASQRGDLAVAEDYLKRGLALREKLAPNSLDMAKSFLGLGVVVYDKGDLKAAENYCKQSLALFEKLAPNSLEVAASLNNLGNVANDRGDLKAAEGYYKQSLAIQEKLAPNSLEVADSLNNLGNVAEKRGDLEAAEGYYKHGLAIQEKLAPNSLNVADSLLNMGIVARDRGDLALAEDYYKRGLALFEQLAPNSLEVAATLGNLGNLANSRGDLTLAEGYHKQDLAITEKLAPNSLNVAQSFLNLGVVADERGDFALAEDYYKRGLTLFEKLAPNSLYVAKSFLDLGVVAGEHGDLAAAANYFNRSLALKEKLAPNSMEVASTLSSLGLVAKESSDFTAAEDYSKRSLALREKLAPNSLEVANSLSTMGNVAYYRGDLAAAKDYYKHSLVLYMKLAPTSLEAISSLIGLGDIQLRQKHPAQALPLLQQTTAIVEDQRGQIASNEARSLFLEQHASEFTLLQRAYLALNQPQNAFATLQRARARSLSDRLAEGNLDFSASASPELLKKQAALDNQRRIAYTSRARLDPDDKADQPKLRVIDQQIASLASQQRLLEADIRQHSPAFAAFAYPKPLDLPATQRLLDPGTLLLAYAVDEEQTYLFTVTRTTFHVYHLPVKEKTLRLQLHNFQVSLSTPNSLDYLPKADALYALLLRPAQKEINASARLLLCPDGPLNTLAFAALHDAASKRYLVQQKPLHTLSSLNAFAELRRRVKERQAGSLPALAVGDPVYPGGEIAQSNDQPGKRAKNKADRQIALNEGQQQFQRMGGKLVRLPLTRNQAETVARVYGPQTVTLLGRQATRSAVLARAGEARILHFGCHGLLDNGDPLASALALTAETGKDDGMLRAYEVLTRLRLKAEVVMLSACEMGLGTERKAEGIVGMTRAFAFAGAQSVVVSLWEIREDSATGLVQSFYNSLKSGKSKDVALQSAMVALLGDVRYRHPYHWAAYVLTGDWR